MTIFQQFAIWMDDPIRYWTLAWFTLAICLTVTFFPQSRSTPSKAPQLSRFLKSSTLFTGLLFLTLLAFRWPFLACHIHLNADEPQLVAQGITLLDDPIFYRSVQSGSAGPLLTYPLLLPALFGFDINLGSARFVGLLLIWLSAIFTYLAARLSSGELAARICVLPAILCFSLSQGPDHTHYSSELVSLPLVALSCFLVLFYKKNPTHRPFLTLFLLGLSLGAMPFSKLQPTLISLSIVPFAFLYILNNRSLPWNTRLKHASTLTAGGLSIPTLLFAKFAAFGVFVYFWQVYIVNNYHYRERGASFFENIQHYLENEIIRQKAYEVFLLVTAIFVLLAILRWALIRSDRKDRPWRTLLFVTCAAAASIYAVMAPGRPFPHYLTLTVFPFCLLGGVLIYDPPHAPNSNRKIPWFRKLPLGTSTAIVLWLLPLTLYALRPITTGFENSHPLLGKIEQILARSGNPASQVINEFKESGDKLTVWGWAAEYYVETQLPMGTRSAVTEFQIDDVPLRPYYRKTALEEFTRNQPTFFVDATGPLSIRYTNRADFGHHIFPELAAYIKENYRLALETPYDQLFIRNDRFDEIVNEQRANQTQN